MSTAMAGKTVLITGATDGIGFVTARELASQGARVLMVGRNEEKGRAALAAINKVAGDARLEFLRADLSTQSEIRRLAAHLTATEPHLDVLVNNAGGIFKPRRESDDDIEMTFALNHLNYFLLTNLVRDLLLAAPSARVVNVASRAHFGAKLDFEDLECRKDYRAWRAYQRSKLANILFTRALSKRLAGTNVTANALHPGFVRTHFGADNALPFRLVLRAAMRVMAISVEEGAKTQTFLASSPKVEGQSGGYYVKSALATPSLAAQDEESAERLWQVSARMTGLDTATSFATDR